MSRLSKFGTILRNGFGGLLVIALLPIAIPVAIVAASVDFVISQFRLRRFCAAHFGEVFLLCTRRRNWFDFVQNNVSPVLPPRVFVVWRESPGFQSRTPTHFVQRSFERLFRVRRPSLPVALRVGRHRLQVVPLHSLLQPIKAAQRTACNPVTQEAVRASIGTALGA